MNVKAEDIEQCFQYINDNVMVSEREENLLKQINEIENQRKLVFDQNIKLSEKLTINQKIIENCYKVLENYKQMFSALNSICFCNKTEINFLINNMNAINDSLYQQNRDLSQKLTENSLKENYYKNTKQLSVESVIKSEPIENTDQLNDRFFNILSENYNQINDKKSVETQVNDNDIDFTDSVIFNFKAKQTTNDGKPDLMSSDDSEDSNTCIESDIDRESDEKDFGSEYVKNVIKDEIIVGIQVNDDKCYEISNNTSLINEIYYEINEQTINELKNNNLNKNNKLSNNEINVNPNELKKLDLTENKGKDYVDEILLSEDLLKCQQKYSQINDKSEKPLIIGNFSNKSEEEKLNIRRKLLQNKCLVKKSAEKLISLSVPRIRFNTENPIRSLVLIGYECPYNGCYYRGLGKYSVNNHVIAKHLEVKQFKCEICDKCFALNKDLIDHKNRVHSNEQIKCNFKDCQFVAKHTSKLQKHVYCVHNIKKYDCLWPGCDAKFVSNYKLIVHNRIHTGEKPYSCDWTECDKEFNSVSALNRHKHIHKEVKPHSCPWNGCEARFIRHIQLRKHIMCHEKGANMRCLCCKNSNETNKINYKMQEIGESNVKEKFNKIEKPLERENLSIKQELIENKDLVQTEKLISLSIPSIDSQEVNPIIGSGSQGFQCPYDGCDYKNAFKVRVDYHINSKHLKLNPFKCQICNKGFPSKTSLYTHKNIVHSKEQLKCNFKDCEYVAKHKSSFKTHQKCVHPNVIRPKPYLCDWPECGAKFRKPYLLREHIDAIHKNIKKYNCLWPGCDAKFATNYNLTQHNRIHTDVKPYACDWPDCDQKFKHNISLKRHKLTHEGVKPYSCPWNGCEVSFLLPSILKRHVICHEKGKNVKCLCCKKSK